MLFRPWCFRRHVRARVRVRGRCDGDRGGPRDRSHWLCDHWHAMLLLPRGPLGSAVIERAVVVVGIVMLVVAVDVDTGVVVDADLIAALT